MKDLEEIWGIPIQSYNARESMEELQKLLEKEKFSIVKLLTVDTLVLTGDQKELADILKTFDLLLIGDEEMLEAAGIKTARQTEEIRSHLLIQLFLKYLIRVRKGIFLITDTAAECEATVGFLKDTFTGISINDTIGMDEADAQSEVIANDINGSEAEVILSLLSSPGEERLLAESRNTICARLWLGCGKEIFKFESGKQKSWLRHKIDQLLLYRMSNNEK